MKRLLFICCAMTHWAALAAEDIVIADFELPTYGEWKVEGDAFGSGPAMGTLPGQMNVGGYKGKRLVNSFLNGDGTTGKLTSPPIRIERDYLCFLIGGGGFEGKTCVNLLLDGSVARTATGPNTQPGGSEDLELQCWDVTALKDKMVTLEIVDQATGGWGHINIDQIVQTDERPKLPKVGPRQKEFTVASHYLVIPIKNGAKATELVVTVDGKPVRRYSAELATASDDVDWYAFFTMDEYARRSGTVSADRATEEGFALVRQANVVPGSDRWYSEDLRPQFHFSQNVGWNNDPNGMVYLDGEWHLFFQHNPVGWKWGNMTWGHAVSKDLVHWEQLPDKLFPKTMATGDCFSGSAIVDVRNTAGWKTGNNDVLVAFLTDTGAGESLAYSNDRGRTFQWYEGNPVVKHRGRDPKVIWYAYGENDTPLNPKANELGGHWVMAVYDEGETHGKNAAFYTSTNLKDWQEQGHLPGYYECTELFELAVDGNKADTRWVVFAGDARYAIGRFDGRRFTPEHQGKHQVHWGKYYASQTFNNSPDGRRIQMGWAQVAMPGAPFNQTFSFPHELTLRTTDEGVRMFAKPIKEIEKLRNSSHFVGRRELEVGTPVEVGVSGTGLEIRATFAVGEAERIGLEIGGERIVYDVRAKRLGEAAMNPVDGKISLQVLVDRPMLEICGNDGRAFITLPRAQIGAVSKVAAFAEGGHANLEAFEVYELGSIWKKP